MEDNPSTIRSFLYDLEEIFFFFMVYEERNYIHNSLRELGNMYIPFLFSFVESVLRGIKSG